MKSNKAGLTEERLGYLRSRARRKRLVILARVIILVGFFGLWEIAAQMKWIDSFIMSCPSRMVETVSYTHLYSKNSAGCICLSQICADNQFFC